MGAGAASRLAQAGSTALYMAAQGGHLEVAQVLIDAGSELNLIARNNVRAAAAARFPSRDPPPMLR